MAQPGMRVSEVPGMPGWCEGLHVGLRFFFESPPFLSPLMTPFFVLPISLCHISLLSSPPPFTSLPTHAPLSPVSWGVVVV